MANTSQQEICQSVLDFVTEGKYPESEKVVAAEFPVSALSKELELLSKARAQVEAEISSLSRENDFDADGWISQAKQLHADIERSRVTAREIVAQHENTNPLRAKVDDAAAKVGLVETEIAFNQAVTDTLEEVQRLSQQLDAGRALLQGDQVTGAIDILESTEQAIKKDNLFANTTVLVILSENVNDLRGEIVECLRSRWNDQLNIDEREAKLVLPENTERLEETVTALVRLEMLAPAKGKFQKDLISAVIEPILLPTVDGHSRGVHIEGTSLRVGLQPSKVSVSELLERIVKVLEFLRQHLHSSILDSLSETFIPILSSKIIASWLSSAIPTELVGLGEFESTLDAVLGFTNTIQNFGWHGQEELVSWVNQAPRLWLTRRRVDSLDQVRKVLASSKGSTKQVERVEIEKVSATDEALLEKTTSDDWDASWDDDMGDDSKEKPAEEKEDEEDVSAWGLDDDTNDSPETAPGASAAAAADYDDEDGDAWGWGDEDDETAVDSFQAKHSVKTNSVNGKDAAHHASPREVTLTERYTVTDIPEAILTIIRQQVMDSDAITHPAHSNSRVVSSGAGLLALPTLILAMFKATATSFYGLKLSSGQMYLYNDSLYLADQVRRIAEEHQLSRLQADIEALERFGKLAYSKEMQTQRTIVTDLLDGAQGFSQCSEQPFLGECENAVSATVDRIRDVHKEWQPILSHSALLQSVGSLVSTVINKIIIEIEDLGDISAAQSERLVSFCNQVSKLEDLFIPETSENAERVPMTAVYVRNWLKFQYLINILESSLADIKFLWLEGELRLEFSPEEVVDLIEALFAESDYRRKAIAEIRRISRNQGTVM
ncbi:ribosome biogenesis protein ytm1 [Aspergillus melleus]|uniref:Ribosome biogenesis protein ytm1 n=1 Tax=Aspergillus melleus TaxID=138277 RepID=A0ACC3AYR9_9EURO|nr:ribosome biogenesis protein ytm1 [Aspergillus melleus]